MPHHHDSSPQAQALPRCVLLLPLALAACTDASDPTATTEPLAWRDGTGSGSEGGESSEGLPGGPGEVFPPPYAVPGQWTFDEPVCGVEPDPTGGGIAQQLGIDPPIPPQPYVVPSCTPLQEANDDCRVVHDAAELQQAALLDPGKNMDIILDDGYYLESGLDDLVPHPAPYLSLARAHRLWAKDAGQAILTFGVVAGGNYCNPAIAAKFDGPEFHGLVFDIMQAEHAVPLNAQPNAPTSALMAWGHSRGMKVHDCWFRGWDAVDRAISALRPDGLEIARVEVLNFERFGILVELGWPPPEVCAAGPAPVVVGDPARLSDLAIHGIGDPEWSSQEVDPLCGNGAGPGAYCPGTQEHGIWIGETTQVDRARIRDVAWTGILVGDDEDPIHRVTLRDVDVDDQGSNEDGWGSGIGFEAGTDGTTLEQFCIGPNVRRGVHAEWNHHGDALDNVNLTIADGWSRAKYFGITLDSGTQDTSIIDVLIDEACLASTAMRNNNDILPYDDCCTTTTWTNLDDSGATNACEVLSGNPPPLAQVLDEPDCTELQAQLVPSCAPFVDSDTACLEVGGMDACPP
ncbi:hypothetical protein [Paraliomyxa miuraensis]|uniref:hypothetical protein n=1 Tax=Paraliomyxa miuraensis TaxID=376150 RepID=UPI002258681F|nr:hypothetical protein [Paraliomyxa miuraensis]MCX4241347.1 hypothetical protein [Paraliomyxa miuraensis]